MTELHPIANHLCSSIDAAALSLPNVAASIDKAAGLITNTFLMEGKVLACGIGVASTISQLLTTSLLHQQEFSRPGLPAINLSNDTSTLSAIVYSNENDNAFSKQVRAIGNKNDCLVFVQIGEKRADTQQLVDIAFERGMSVVLICASINTETANTDTAELTSINVSSNTIANALEASVFVANALVRSIESKLFGAPI